MGCGSSVHSSQPGHGVPVSASQVQEVGARDDTTSPAAAGSVAKSNQVGDSTSPCNNAFSVNPEPHEEFLPCINPSALELACRSTVEKLVPRKSEEHTRSEIGELIQQWRECGQLADIESYSLSVPPSLTSSIVELSAFLTRSSANYIMTLEGPEVHIQVAKAYCIYSWIANSITFDRQLWQAYQSGDDNLSLESNTQAEHVLEKRVTVSNGYANLFKSLANESGLAVEVIHGNIKAWKSQSMESPENDFEASKNNTHTWNSITLGGTTYLVDCTMGSGFISPSTEYQKDFTCHFFAVRRQNMILTHWPQRAKQQLLKEPLTLSKFRPLIPLSPKVAEFGINPDTWSEFLEIPVETRDPIVVIKMTCNTDVKLVAKLSNIRQESINTQEIADRKLVFIDKKISNIGQETSRVTIRAVVPYTGWYVLNVYACKSLRNAPSSNYEVVLSYQIQCNTDIGSQFQIGYPTMYDMAAVAFDFRVLHWNKPMPDYCCEISSGKLDIAFHAKPDLLFSHYIVEGKSENLDNPSNVHYYNTLTAQSKCGDPCLYVLRCVFPSQGWWTVYLCTTKAVDSDSQQPTVSGYTTIFKYCVYVKSGIANQSFPHITAPYINFTRQETILTPGSEILNVPFCSSKAFEFYCYLTYETQTSELVENYATVAVNSSPPKESQEQQHYNLSAIFPKEGKWYVHVFGRDFTTANQKYTGLFTLSVNVESALRDMMFPTINLSIATALNISCYDTGCITFRDDGCPFTYKFRAPRNNIHLVPNITINDKDKDIFDKKYLQQCTLLSPSAADDSELSVYTMNVAFPSAGTWSVQLFGAVSNSNSDGYDLVMHIQLQVTKPTPDMRYPTIYPSFYDLGLSIPDKLLLYSQVSEAAEINLPFHSPEGVVFDTRLSQGDKVFINQAIVKGTASNTDNSTQNHNLHIIFPKTGEWIIHLYAGSCNVALHENYQREINIKKEAVLELKIKALSCNDALAFPQVFDSFYSKFSLKLDEERYPLISRVDRLPTKITIPFYSPPNVQFWHSAKSLESEAADANPITRMYSDPQTGLHELSVEVAECGQLVVTLNAQMSDSSDNIADQKQKWITVLKHTVKAL